MKKTFQLWIGLMVFWLGFAHQGIANDAAKSYVTLKPGVVQQAPVVALREDTPNKVQVILFFSYGCSWCHRLEEPLQAWKATLPEHVSVVREPVVFQPSWRPLAKAYYTANALGRMDKEDLFHEMLFKAGQAKLLSSDEKVRNFFIDQSVEPEAFDKIYQSFSVNMQLERTNGLLRAFEVMYVPVFVVNGPKEAYLTSVDQAGGQEQLFETLSLLVQKVHQEQMGGV